MNEETKHIESCRAEDPLAQTMEACGNESDLQAALQPLLVETMPGYVPVPTTAPTSPIAELPGVLISIIRRVATKPLTILGERPAKQSLLGTLLDTWNAIRNRLSGNPSLGIPDRTTEMTAHSLPTALALLNDRKITNGGSTTDGIPDGMSLARLLCDTSAANSVTEIVDDNTGWTMNKGFTWSLFPNLLKIAFGCKKITAWSAAPTTLTQLDMNEVEQLAVNGTNIYYNNPNLTEIDVPELYEMDNGFTYDDPASACFISKCSNLKKVRIRHLRKYGEVDGVSFSNGGAYCCLIHSCENLEEVYLDDYTGYKNWRIIRNCPKVWKVVLGNISSGVPSLYGSTAYPFSSCVNLYHLEIAGCTVSLDLSSWNPTTALANNLQQFLLNFREFIALRLANQTGLSKLTLTLSANVFSAVFTNESGSTEEIVARNAIRDEIRGEITDRNWKVTDSTNNFNN